MHIKRNIKKVKDRIYTTVLLVESYRDGDKVKHRTVLNLSKLEKQQIDAIDASLKGNSLSSLDIYLSHAVMFIEFVERLLEKGPGADE
ncbi:hypothetical protein MBAV_005626 [Candidatus Magnetobacterium bavaricum]|uniref:Uncharacterized protein n=1 Tax=Candidatus Magnetobacterium bavaricum TaxID=29290 RepID=A0A0F3GJW2_9BACT|nr:hypothetical protein MBAV_005626 [Candidatus Magnetobacterium bavaricum]